MKPEPINFSIVIPTWNRASPLLQLLSSIVAQQYPANKIEIIVVDSFSTDETAEIVKLFLRNHPEYRLKYLNTEINTGDDDETYYFDQYDEECLHNIIETQRKIIEYQKKHNHHKLFQQLTRCNGRLLLTFHPVN
jgi:glycosyltransferase involved in cell wall biosynthesis